MESRVPPPPCLTPPSWGFIRSRDIECFLLFLLLHPQEWHPGEWATPATPSSKWKVMSIHVLCFHLKMLFFSPLPTHASVSSSEMTLHPSQVVGNPSSRLFINLGVAHLYTHHTYCTVGVYDHLFFGGLWASGEYIVYFLTYSITLHKCSINVR